MASIADVVAAAPSFALMSKDPYPWFEVDYQRQTGSGECSYLVELNELSSAMDVIDGVNELVTISTSPLIQVTRSVPLQHPYEPLLYMSRVRCEFRPTAEVKYPSIERTGPLVKLNVGFYLPPYGLSGDPYQQVEMVGTEQHMPMDGAAFLDGTTPANDVSRPVSGSSYSVTVFDAPAMDDTHEAYLNAMAGGLNSAVWRGNAIGRVRFHSPKVRYASKRDGSRTATYSLQFDTRPFDWNMELKRDGSLAKLLVGGAEWFNYINFNDLFI